MFERGIDLFCSSNQQLFFCILSYMLVQRDSRFFGVTCRHYRRHTIAQERKIWKLSVKKYSGKSKSDNVNLKYKMLISSNRSKKISKEYDVMNKVFIEF